MPAAVQISKPSIAADEWAVRVDLAAAYRLVASARVPGPEHHFLLNRYDMGFEEITASSLVKVDLDGVPVDGPTSVNPAAFTIHSALHMSRDNTHCVIHLHTPHGQAVSAMRDGLLPITQTALGVIGDLAYHAYEGIATDHQERVRILADLGARNVLILRNHGTLAVGETIADAFLRIYFLERACGAQVLALSAARDGVVLALSGIVEHVTAQTAAIGQKVARDLVWPVLIRRMDRLDPSFRT